MWMFAALAYLDAGVSRLQPAELVEHKCITFPAARCKAR